MFPSIVMKDINEIVSALLDGTLQESETIELKRTLPHDLPNVINGYNYIGGILKPANCVDIEFERFDIDAMPGSSPITIK